MPATYNLQEEKTRNGTLCTVGQFLHDLKVLLQPIRRIIRFPDGPRLGGQAPSQRQEDHPVVREPLDLFGEQGDPQPGGHEANYGWAPGRLLAGFGG